MKECISREAALAALKTYNKEPFHILHGLTVEGVMRWYANELGYGEDADFWATVGLLHDIDFEMWPEQHCRKAPELLKKAGCSEEFIHAVCSHGYGLCCDVEPTHEMEKVLFAADELTGLVGAAARMRPSKSVMDMEVSSLKKKYKDKKFAAGCSRDVIRQGAENLGWTHRGADGKDHPGYAQLRGERQQGDGDAGLSVYIEKNTLREYTGCSFLRIIRRVVGYRGGAEGFYAAAQLHLIRPLRGHLSPCGSVGPRI